jgi:hypothetical protein
VLFSSCEELDSDIDIKEAESKIILNGFMTPSDSVVKINVYQTQPTLGQSLDVYVRDARLTLSDGITTDTFLYLADESVYILNKRVSSNTTYTVRAELPDGRWAEASCTTPDEQPLDFTYTIDSIVNGNKIEYTVKMNWTDLSPKANTYYRTDAEMYYLIIDTLTQTYQFITTELIPNIAEINKGTGLNTQMEVVYKSNKEVRFVEKYLELHLLMIDEDYYQFELTKKSNYSGYPNYEYSKLYSNVKNGFGIVASYNNYVLKPLNLN